MTEPGARRVSGGDPSQQQSQQPSQQQSQQGEPTTDVDPGVLAASKIGRLFDVRLVIGGLLTLYGVILLVKGAFDSHTAVARAAGIRINLWTGLGMLVVGLLFFLWARLAPLKLADESELHDELAMGAAPTIKGHS